MPKVVTSSESRHFLLDVFESSLGQARKVMRPAGVDERRQPFSPSVAKERMDQNRNLAQRIVEQVGERHIAIDAQILNDLLRANEQAVVDMVLEAIETGKPVKERFKLARANPGQLEMNQNRGRQASYEGHYRPMTPIQAFETSLLVDRVATRFATEFPTPEALKKYLRDHPDADKSKHSVKKQDGKQDKADSGVADQESAKSVPRKKLMEAADELEALTARLNPRDKQDKKDLKDLNGLISHLKNLHDKG